MALPSPAELFFARSSLPARRVSPSLANANKPVFATVLQNATGKAAPQSQPLPRVSPLLRKTSVSLGPEFTTAPGAGPAPISRSQIVQTAEQLMNVPYVWGGTSASGLDCSAFVSRAWGVPRQTTETLSSVARPIDKEQLQTGDALNLTMANDPEGDGHVRMFDKWANPEHTQMWVYEETPPRSVHHVINWDPKYQPMRRLNVTDA